MKLIFDQDEFEHQIGHAVDVSLHQGPNMTRS